MGSGLYGKALRAEGWSFESRGLGLLRPVAIFEKDGPSFLLSGVQI